MQGQALRVQALGVCGAPAPHRLTTCFRLGEGLLIDAGAAAHAIPVEEWNTVRHVLLSHSHLDHTMAIPFLLAEAQPAIYGLRVTLDAVRESLLDDRIWPDLSARATWHEIEEGETLDLDGLRVEVGPADHTVACVSYFANDTAFVGDTRQSDEVIAWAASQAPRACIVECSYPDSRHEIAVAFGHQSSCDLAAWREGLGCECELWLTHVKPKHELAIHAECEALGDPRLRFLHDGDLLSA